MITNSRGSEVLYVCCQANSNLESDQTSRTRVPVSPIPSHLTESISKPPLTYKTELSKSLPQPQPTTRHYEEHEKANHHRQHRRHRKQKRHSKPAKPKDTPPSASSQPRSSSSCKYLDQAGRKWRKDTDGPSQSKWELQGT